MKELYLKITELLKTIPEIRWVDLEMGQLQEEQPPVAFPCVLVSIDIPRTEGVDYGIQNLQGNFTLHLHCKELNPTHSESPKQSEALKYLDLVQKIYLKFQGYNDDVFSHFNRVSVRQNTIRRGVKSVALSFDTAWYDDSANS